jgi:hypothetical protein
MTSNPDVEEAVIKPMTATFPPPTHLRGKPHAIEAALTVYRRALGRFERPVLEQAFQKTAAENEYVMWPKCAALLKAAEHFHRLAHPHARDADAWVEKAAEMADAYVRRFMKASTHAARAREGGYEPEVRRYVEAASWVQAQYLLGRSGVAYDGLALFGDRLCRDEKEREREAEFFEKAREQAARGSIRVHVPAEMVRRWQRQAEGQGRGRG